MLRIFFYDFEFFTAFDLTLTPSHCVSMLRINMNWD
jgi:hypothetical protein